MKPELILQSDVLDILFENKNKIYGAYELRRHYNSRLTKSLMGTLGIVLVFAGLQSYKVPHRKGTVGFTVSDTITLADAPIIPEPPKPQEKQIPKPKASEVYNVPEIVTDDKVKDTIATMDDLVNKQISNHRVQGEDVGVDEVPDKGPGLVPATEPTAAKEEVISILNKAEFMPEFPGGLEALKKFMQRNLREPDYMEEDKKLVVIAQFVVDLEGNIRDMNIIQHARPDLDNEVLRVIRMMPRWKPGMQNGRKVEVFFKLPVTFIAAE